MAGECDREGERGVSGGLGRRFFLPGGYRPDKIIEGLVPHMGKPDNTIAGFHVFTFNDLEPTEAWRRRTLQSLA